MADDRFHAFDDPIHDQLVGIVLALGAELWALRDRFTLLERALADNDIDVSGRGIVAGSGTSPVIDGNTVCGADASIFVADTATPELGDNQTCEDGVTG